MSNNIGATRSEFIPIGPKRDFLFLIKKKTKIKKPKTRSGLIPLAPFLVNLRKKKREIFTNKTTVGKEVKPFYQIVSLKKQTEITNKVA